MSQDSFAVIFTFVVAIFGGGAVFGLAMIPSWVLRRMGMGKSALVAFFLGIAMTVYSGSVVYDFGHKLAGEIFSQTTQQQPEGTEK